MHAILPYNLVARTNQQDRVLQIQIVLIVGTARRQYQIERAVVNFIDRICVIQAFLTFGCTGYARR